ncbi:Uncharacterised protein [uncultured archaeon]|nr:Uncharacterised protein [uncultured archaeon]
MKSIGQLAILMVAVAAIGVFAVPNTVSVGKGQHKFKNGGSVECGKCHANSGDAVLGELKLSGVTQYTSGTGGSAIESDPAGTKIHNGSYFWSGGIAGSGAYLCSKCHIVVTGGTGKDNHTGITINVICATCHSTEYSKLTTASAHTDAHMNFGLNANAGASGTYACMGCHTGVAVSGSPSYSYSAAKTSVDGLTIGNGTAPGP